MRAEREAAAAWFGALRDRLCARLEALERRGRFTRRVWRRGDGGQDAGGGEMAILRGGEVFEKAAVLVSAVYGPIPPELRAQAGARAKGARRFWAGGVSAIIHPRNPHVPAGHMNTRYIEMKSGWFGGGADLTPMLARRRDSAHEDARDFHAALERACAGPGPGDYARFRQNCDAYFYLPHRREPRGVGGIFYDDLNSGDRQADFAFTRAVGEAFLDVYPRLVGRRMGEGWSPEERREQAMFRARYAEFNLLCDRGTRFGLQTGGDIEAIFSSLPPEAVWP